MQKEEETRQSSSAEAQQNAAPDDRGSFDGGLQPPESSGGSKGPLNRVGMAARAAILGLLPFLERIPRLALAGLAFVLFGLAAWHEVRTPATSWDTPLRYLTHWETPRQLYPERALPAFDHAVIESVETVPGGKRVWIAGGVGLLAYSDNEGESWTNFHYDTTKGTMIAGDLQEAVARGPLSTWHVEAAQASSAKQAASQERQTPTQQYPLPNAKSSPKQGPDKSQPLARSKATVAPSSTRVPPKNPPLVQGSDVPTSSLPTVTVASPKNPPDWGKIEFYDAMTARLATAGGYFLTTSDGGATWSPNARISEVRVRPTCGSLLLKGSGAAGIDHAEIYGAVMLHGPSNVFLSAPSEDRQLQIMVMGSAMRSVEAVNAKIYGIAGQASSEAWAAGESSKEGAVVYHTADRGATWTTQFSQSGFAFRDIAFREDGKTGLAGGTKGAILRTRDGGQHWEPVTLGAAEPGKLSTDFAWWQQPLRIPALLSLLEIALGLVILIPAVLPQSVAHAVERTIANVTVSDAPVISSAEDSLGFGPVARAISGLLRNKATKLPITLAITAKWGRGKTSLMSMVQQDLKAAGWRTVWFNAWHHQEELSLLAALLQTVRQKAPPMLLERGGIRYRLKLIGARLLQWRTLWVAAGCLVLYNAESAVHEQHKDMYGCAAQYLYERSGGIVAPSENLCGPAEAASANGEKKAADKPGVLEFLMRLLFDAARKAERFEKSSTPGVHIIPLLALSALVIALGWQVLQSFGANPAELLTAQTAHNTVSELDARSNFLEKFRKQYGDVVEALGNYRLVILVDDLDRCRPEKISEMLEAANYLMAAGPCAIVMALEENAVIAGLGLSFQRMAEELEKVPDGHSTKGDFLAEARYKREEFARNYVEKLLNVVVQVPSVDVDQFGRALAGTNRRQETPEERRARRLQKFASVARVPAAAIIVTAGILLGGGLISEELRKYEQQRPAGKIEAQVPEKSTAPPTEQAPVVSDFAKSTVVPSNIPAGEPPVYFAAKTPLPQRWFVSWQQRLAWAFLFVTLAATLLARRPPPAMEDSDKFTEALRLWSPMLAEVNPSLRFGKRVLNRLRYLAMLEREAEKDQRKATPGAPDVPATRIPQTLLVALGVLDAARPGVLESGAAFENYLAGLSSTTKEATPRSVRDSLTWHAHESRFGHIGQKELEQFRQRLLELSAGIAAR